MCWIQPSREQWYPGDLELKLYETDCLCFHRYTDIKSVRQEDFPYETLGRCMHSLFKDMDGGLNHGATDNNTPFIQDIPAVHVVIQQILGSISLMYACIPHYGLPIAHESFLFLRHWTFRYLHIIICFLTGLWIITTVYCRSEEIRAKRDGRLFSSAFSEDCRSSRVCFCDGSLQCA